MPKNYDPTCRITAQAIQLGQEVQLDLLERINAHLVAGMVVSVGLNVVAIVYFLTRGLQ